MNEIMFDKRDSTGYSFLTDTIQPSPRVYPTLFTCGNDYAVGLDNQLCTEWVKPYVPSSNSRSCMSMHDCGTFTAVKTGLSEDQLATFSRGVP